MYQFKTEIRNLNRYSQLGRIIYNGPAFAAMIGIML